MSHPEKLGKNTFGPSFLTTTLVSDFRGGSPYVSSLHNELYGLAGVVLYVTFEGNGPGELLDVKQVPFVLDVLLLVRERVNHVTVDAIVRVCCCYLERKGREIE